MSILSTEEEISAGDASLYLIYTAIQNFLKVNVNSMLGYRPAKDCPEYINMNFEKIGMLGRIFECQS